MIVMHSVDVKSYGPVIKYIQENKIHEVLIEQISDSWVICGPDDDGLEAVLIVEGFMYTYGYGPD